MRVDTILTVSHVHYSAALDVQSYRQMVMVTASVSLMGAH